MQKIRSRVVKFCHGRGGFTTASRLPSLVKGPCPHTALSCCLVSSQSLQDFLQHVLQDWASAMNPPASVYLDRSCLPPLYFLLVLSTCGSRVHFQVSIAAWTHPRPCVHERGGGFTGSSGVSGTWGGHSPCPSADPPFPGSHLLCFLPPPDSPYLRHAWLSSILGGHLSFQPSEPANRLLSAPITREV